MPILDHPHNTVQAMPSRHKFTRDDVARAVETGFLSTSGYELIEGDILDKMGKKQGHVYTTFQAQQWLVGVFGAAFVQTQDPIAIDTHNEPEPDLAVLRHDRAHYLRAGTPPPADVLLLVEVSDATLQYDRTTKALLYARAGIADYWIVDVAGRRILAHRQPSPDGYWSVIAFAEDEMLAPLAAPQSGVLVADLLPPILP